MKIRTMNRKQLLGILLAVITVGLASCANTAGSAAGGTKSYPLATCIVTDNKLGSMGDPVTKVYNGQEVKFCCQPCVKKFEANPEKYLSKLP